MKVSEVLSVTLVILIAVSIWSPAYNLRIFFTALLIFVLGMIQVSAERREK